METKFQTSFIPRKPLVQNTSSVQPSHNGSSSLLTLISFVIFGLSVAGAIVVLGWQKVEQSNLTKNKEQLEINKKQFGSDIEFLKRFNSKINLTKGLVDNHLSISNIFSIIGDFVVDGVRFKSFEFTLPVDSAKENLKITMKGEASSYDTLAYQSDVLGLNKTIKNPVVSDLGQDEKGIVGFSFAGEIPVAQVFYKNQFTIESPHE